MARVQRSAILSLAICGISLSATAIFAEPTTPPAAQPATTQPAIVMAPATTQPTADAMLGEIDAAYAKLTSAQFDGTISGHFDVHGQAASHESTFTSSFVSPNKFRHESRDDALVGSTGSVAYSYLQQRDQYQSADAPKARSASSEWPSAVIKILHDQNPALLLALSNSAAAELKEISKDITVGQPTVVDGVSYPTLRFDVATDHEIVTVLVGPATHLLRRVSFDFRKPMEKAGTTDVKQAEVTIDYGKTAADAPVEASLFAWTPPTGAALVTAAAVKMADDSPDAVKDLIGQPAPDFTLKNLQDKDVKLSSLKGSVVVVDFWATWCGPCVASLPHLDELYKEEGPHGLKVLAVAVNAQEEKDEVSAFIDKKKWSFPVVYDADGTVSEKYKADAIPETVVIGKDGVVKQIFVGGNREEEIKALVAKEMK